MSYNDPDLQNDIAEIEKFDDRIDFQVLNAGSIFVLTPLTPEADAWVEEKVGINEETQYWGKKGIVIEPRYIQQIIDGLLEDGLKLEQGLGAPFAV